MSPNNEFGVPDDLVVAAIRAADRSGKNVADVSTATIAQAAGVPARAVFTTAFLLAVAGQPYRWRKGN